ARAVAVVRHGARAGERLDLVGLGPQALGLVGVELQNLRARDVLAVLGHQRRAEVRGRRTGALEDLLGDLLTVDRAADGLTAQVALLAAEVLQRLGEIGRASCRERVYVE